MTVDHHTALEEALFRAVNAGAGPVLDAVAVTLSAKWFGVLTGAAVVLVILTTTAGRRRLALLAAFALAFALSDAVGSQVLRPLLGRMRPCYALAPGTFRWLAPAGDVGSLPSLHAANFFAMALVAWAASRRAGIVALGVAAGVALSRIYVGVHWPTDVLAGAAWGSLCAWVALWAARAVAARLAAGRAPAPPAPPGG